MIRSSRAGRVVRHGLGELGGELVGAPLEEGRERLAGEVPLVEEEERLAAGLPPSDRAGRLAGHEGRSDGRCASISSR